MRSNDKELISSDVIQSKSGKKAVLQRVINAVGNPYSAIEENGVELWSCPSQEEAKMVEWWEENA